MTNTYYIYDTVNEELLCDSNPLGYTSHEEAYDEALEIIGDEFALEKELACGSLIITTKKLW